MAFYLPAGCGRTTLIIIFAVVALITLGIAWALLGTFTIIGILILLAGLFLIIGLEQFQYGMYLLIIGIILIGIEYII